MVTCRRRPYDVASEVAPFYCRDAAGASAMHRTAGCSHWSESGCDPPIGQQHVAGSGPCRHRASVESSARRCRRVTRSVCVSDVGLRNVGPGGRSSWRRRPTLTRRSAESRHARARSTAVCRDRRAVMGLLQLSTDLWRCRDRATRHAGTRWCDTRQRRQLVVVRHRTAVKRAFQGVVRRHDRPTVCHCWRVECRRSSSAEAS